MADLMVQINGVQVPLKDCAWFQCKACGCIVAALLAVQECDTYATAEQAHKAWRRDKRSREKDSRDGLTIELMTMAHYREHIGANWECDQHKKASAW
jgi:hypothetical protein